MLIELQVAIFRFAGFPETYHQDERLLTISWSAYLIVGILYSALIFFGEIPKDRREIFSKRNKRSLFQILAIHASFVVFLLYALRVSSYVVRYLPSWMTYEIDLGDAYDSVADLIVVIGAFMLAALEKLAIIHTADEPESANE